MTEVGSTTAPACSSLGRRPRRGGAWGAATSPRRSPAGPKKARGDSRAGEARGGEMPRRGRCARRRHVLEATLRSGAEKLIGTEEPGGDKV